ncbi:MAG: thermonuclease family protein [Dysgonomonas sp.]|nr:thermonuclease family protein [Dysgonomonas sp.]
MLKLIFITCILLIKPSVQFFTGYIVRVIDGDTVVLLTEDKKQVKIRLDGIDCPEKAQDYGNKATLYIRELCYNKEVKVLKTGTDRYGRILGVLYIDSINVNEALIRHGLAWHYKRYSNSLRLDSLEQLARKEKLNLWKMPNPIPPWEYRKTLGNRQF